VKEYRLLQHRLGTTRDVSVLPVSYVTDNRVILDCITQRRPRHFESRWRSRDSLYPWRSQRGGHNYRYDRALVETRERLRLARQINMKADQIVAAKDLFNRLPSPVVFDSMGNLPPVMGVTHPAFTVIRKLIDKGRTWVKLTFVATLTKDGPPAYADVTKVAQALPSLAKPRRTERGHEIRVRNFWK